MLISQTNSMTQTHALFLEWHCLQAARKAGRYKDSNGNSGSKPHTLPPLQADCLEIFETGQIILATLGYPIFNPVAKPIVSSTPPEIFHCRAKGADGQGMYTPEGFVVLNGSHGHAQNAPAISASYERLRETLIESGVMHVDGKNVVFDKDYLFSAPSAAAAAILGRNANGWTEWKTEAGATLDEVKRAVLTETT